MLGLWPWGRSVDTSSQLPEVPSMPARALKLLVSLFALGCLMVGSAEDARADQDCIPSDMLLVVDYSGSMSSNNKWSHASAAFNDVLSTFGSKLRFGLIMFSSNAQLRVSVNKGTAGSIRGILNSTRPTGMTAMVCALNLAYTHFQSVIAADQHKNRRRYVLLITDGMPNNCGSNPVPSVAKLRQVASGGRQYDVKTYVIGFGSGVNGSMLTNMAKTGGTSKYYQASNRTNLRSILQSIALNASTEICDGKDNDCDGSVDEGLARSCYSGPSGTAGKGACKTGSSNCIGGVWRSCSGEVVPAKESCNNKDDDCDGSVDEGLARSCNSTCGQGSEKCRAGKWVDCNVRKPTTETCNNHDDDCDGKVDDNVTRPCSTVCGPGTEICAAGVWGTCSAPKPEPEICDGRDNDCNGRVDDGQLCPNGECKNGKCLSKCKNQECPVGQYGGSDGLCHDKPCNPACPSGQVCKRGKCVAPTDCYTSGCTPGFHCRSGKCVPDPCASVKCPAGEFCRAGKCRDSCGQVSCPKGERCLDGKCVADPCAGAACGKGQACNSGRCAPETCKPGTCGSWRSCIGGRCVDDPCVGVKCPKGEYCVHGQCVTQKTDPRPDGGPPAEGGVVRDGGGAQGGDLGPKSGEGAGGGEQPGGGGERSGGGLDAGSVGDRTDQPTGCVCSVEPDAGGVPVVGLAVLLLALGWRRRRNG